MDIGQNLTKVEEGFNIAGSIPIVAIVSGLLRITVAKIQFIIGGIVALCGLIGQMIHNGSEKMELLSKRGVEHMTHGGMNALRGLGECLVGCTLVGPLVLLVVQASSKDKFEPRMKYEQAAAPQPAV